MAAETESGRGLRRKSAETWAFVGPRKSLNFSPRFKTLIVLTAGYQLTPRLASSEMFPARKVERRGRRGPLGRHELYRSALSREPMATVNALPKWRRRLYRDPAGRISSRPEEAG
jgi:hypothetical protein